VLTDVMSNHVQKIAPQLDTSQPLLSDDDLRELETDPAKMETFTRLLGAVNLDNLFRYMQNPDINPASRIEFQKMLNKMGRLEPDPKASTAGTGPQVVINITRAIDAAMDTIEHAPRD